MSAYLISEDDQATLQCTRDLASLIACQVTTDIPGPQVSAFAQTVYMQLEGVLSRARLSFDVDAVGDAGDE